MPAYNSVILTVAFCILIVLAGCYLATRKFSWLVKNRTLILAAVTILGIAIYSIGYLASDKIKSSPQDFIIAGLMAVFSTGRMFVLENDYGELVEAVLTPAFRIAFGLTMALAMLTVVLVVLSLFGFGFLSALRVRILRLFGTRRTMYIFSCLTKRTLALAKDIKKEDPRCLLLFLTAKDSPDPDKENRLIGKAAAMDNAYIHALDKDPDELNDFCVFPSLKKTQVHFIALHENLQKNTELALKLARLMQPGAMKDKVTLHVLTDSLLYESAFEKSELSGINIVPLDINALASQDLLGRLPILRYARAEFLDGRTDGSLTVMVIGSGKAVPFLYRDLLIQGQMPGLRLHLIAAANEVCDTAAQFQADNPEANRYANLEWVPVTPGSAEFFSFFRDRCKEADIVICAGETDEENAKLTRTLRRIAQDDHEKILFCVRFHTHDFHQLVFAGEPGGIMAFGEDAMLERAGIVINEKLDHMAKAVHRYYLNVYSGGKPWQQLSIYERESSRALALHILTKLHALHMELKEDSEAGKHANPYDTLLALRPDIVENLAVGEHMRWCAYLAAHGWTQLPIGDTFQKADPLLKRHPCLASWEELVRIGQTAGRDYQELDRALIRKLASIAADGDMRIITADSGNTPESEKN